MSVTSENSDQDDFIRLCPMEEAIHTLTPIADFFISSKEKIEKILKAADLNDTDFGEFISKQDRETLQGISQAFDDQFAEDKDGPALLLALVKQLNECKNEIAHLREELEKSNSSGHLKTPDIKQNETQTCAQVQETDGASQSTHKINKPSLTSSKLTMVEIPNNRPETSEVEVQTLQSTLITFSTQTQSLIDNSSETQPPVASSYVVPDRPPPRYEHLASQNKSQVATASSEYFSENDGIRVYPKDEEEPVPHARIVHNWLSGNQTITEQPPNFTYRDETLRCPICSSTFPNKVLMDQHYDYCGT